ncbi:uncharacterized protein LOC127720879 [Mytilus californianus]|uniref:uncharacterized protein LOC127720879 n=1 Tax=Mytilus californianus TaxID=6549 RepID=UPI002246DCD0|nr:uncharacterized protein LOC127720879 [Mytilus californianus]
MGDPENNYTLRLLVYIYDVYDDYNVSEITITSGPPLTSNDTNAFKKLFENYDYKFAMVDKGGNNKALMRLMESTASTYKDLTLPKPTTPDLSTPMKCAYYVDSGEKQSDTKSVLQQSTETMVTTMDEKTPDENSEMGLNSEDAGFVAKAVNTIISNKALFTDKTSKKVSKNLRKVMKNILKRTKIEPRPAKEILSSKRAANEMVNGISETLSYWKTAGSENLEKELKVEDVEDDFREYYSQHPEKQDEQTTFDELVQKCYKNKRKIKKKQKEMAEATKDSAEDLIESLDEVLDMTSTTTCSGGGEQLINRSGVVLSLDKDSKEVFLNNKSEVYRKGISLEFDNESLANVSDGTNINLQVTVMDTSPILHAKNASKITGQVINIAVKDELNNKIDVPLKMKIKNHGVTYFTEHVPYYEPKDPDQMMFFKSKKRSDSDVLIWYIKLDDELMQAINQRDLYYLFAKSGSQPSSTDFDFKRTVKATDMETYGYKVFIREHHLKEGDVYIALKPIQAGLTLNDSDSNTRHRRSATRNETVSLSGINHTDISTSNVSLAIVTTSCMVYDPNSTTWTSNGCSVLQFSTLNETVCQCEPAVGSIFSLSFASPNMIDLNTVWSKFDPANAAVYGTLVALIVIYVIFVLILRRYDRKDAVRVRI